MFLGILFFITLTADLWLSWMLGSWVGIGVFLTLVPLSLIVTLSGGIALGLVGMIFGKHDDLSHLKRFMRHFLRGWAWLVCIAWSAPWILFTLLQFSNNIAPATVPKITISNGEKTVVFQSMVHIGSRGFYDEIQNDMTHLRGQEYVFLYEGITAGSPESIEKLSRLMNMSVSEKMYTLFADMSGLITQDAKRYIGILPSTNVDLTTDEIIELAGESDIDIPSSSVPSIFDTLESRYPEFTPFQKQISQIVARGILNMLLRVYTEPLLEKKLKKEMPIFEIILDKRNAIIAQAISESPIPNIYIHYGALHYSGVLRLLQEKDPRWQEIARTEFQVIR